jgi:hypothetical protein
VTTRPEVPREIVAKLRLICLDLPEAYVEAAWVGTRWMIKKKTFAHVLMIGSGWPPAYAKVAKTRGPACVLTFRTAEPAVEIPRFGRPPFFRPGWWPDIAGMMLDARTDWYDTGALITKSYCVLAPQKLAKLVDAAPD